MPSTSRMAARIVLWVTGGGGAQAGSRRPHVPRVPATAAPQLHSPGLRIPTTAVLH